MEMVMTRSFRRVLVAVWALGALLVCIPGCPDGATGTDSAVDLPSRDDLADDGLDAGLDATPDDLGRDTAVRDDGPTADLDADKDAPTGCVPGMTIACACTDGRMSAQECRNDRSYGPCVCTGGGDGGAEVGVPDVVLPPLGARLIAPQSVSRVTSRRPTLRWVLPAGVTRARVELCGDRACTRMLAQQEVSGTSWRPATMLAPGVVWWRVRGLASDGSVAWTSATWEFVVGQRDAPVDTNFGTIRDFNGDGFDDVAVTAGLTGGPEAIVVYAGRSSGGTLVPSQQFNIGRFYVSQHVLGDFNGDGLADLASRYQNDVPRERDDVVQVRYGSPTGLPATASIVLQHTRWYPFAMTIAAGDFNGDGFSDIALIAANEDSMPAERAYILLYHGGPSGLPLTPRLGAETPTSRMPQYGLSSFVSVGDPNADGYTDLVMSSFQSRNAFGIEEGRVWLTVGHPSVPLVSHTALPTPTRTGHFGLDVAGVGDLNGDGIADFAVSSSEEVSVYLGSSTSLVTRPYRTIVNPEPRCYLDLFGFGSDIGGAGDFNGDGRADLSIGARCLPADDLRFGVGTAFLYPGQTSGVTDSPAVFRGPANDSWFGTFVTGVGDFNRDGFDELAIAQFAPYNLPDGSYVGASTFLLLGSADGPSRSREWLLRGSISNLRSSPP